MPWIAEHEGRRVAPEYVDDDTVVSCPECGAPMKARDPADRARHFWHHTSAGGGGDSDGSRGTCVGVGGESDPHKKFKSMAVSRLRDLYEGKYEIAQPERVLGEDTDLPSGKNIRKADAFLEFSESSDKLGKGLVIEVQYRNESKDTEAAEADYLSLGYSVLWTDESDYSDDRCQIDYDELIDRVIPVWPTAAPDTSSLTWDFEGIDMEAFRHLHARWFRSGQHATKVLADNEYLTTDASWRRHFSYQRASLAFENEIDFEPPSIPATLPPEWCDQQSREIWRDQYWPELFSRDAHAEQFISEVRSAESTAHPTVEIELPLESFLRSEPTTRGEAIYHNELMDAWKSGKRKQRLSREYRDAQKPDDPERPSGPFDDVQCRDCGTYWHYKKVHTECPECGTDVDFQWNLDTRRVSEKAVTAARDEN